MHSLVMIYPTNSLVPSIEQVFWLEPHLVVVLEEELRVISLNVHTKGHKEVRTPPPLLSFLHQPRVFISYLTKAHDSPAAWLIYDIMTITSGKKRISCILLSSSWLLMVKGQHVNEMKAFSPFSFTVQEDLDEVKSNSTVLFSAFPF